MLQEFKEFLRASVYELAMSASEAVEIYEQLKMDNVDTWGDFNETLEMFGYGHLAEEENQNEF